ncbi:hypothetical protein HNQ60_004719 [Povalibacter uvarum]|uniref:DUF4386 family protein n=1 Tax=Povalibacter uvarum TaxID=732238 RepID=A0A841HV53_9GAMM|nr:DUF4386 family protein [Povalibacter uvarum]MBB6095828.1 hypothetical protein [Povalibacter uvarum]
MNRLQQAGGIAALFEALAYIVGFAVMATALNPGAASEGWTSEDRLTFILDNKLLFQLWTLFIYVNFGIALVVLSVALHERLSSDSTLMKIATPFGLIWAGMVVASGMVANVGLDSAAALSAHNMEQAATHWRTIAVIQDGLGGGVEIVGGVWLLLVSAAALNRRVFPRALNVLGVLVGIAGILTAIPALGALGAAFGLGQIPWFIGVGLTLLRNARITLEPSPSP